MKIEEKDVPEVQRVLKEQLEKGNRYYIHDMSSEKLKPMHVIGHTYADKGEALLYARVFEEQTKAAQVVLPIAELVVRITRITELKEVSDPGALGARDVGIDERFLLKQEAARQEIFGQQLKRQMADIGFTPDNPKELTNHLEMDTQRFTLSGTHQVEGQASQPYQATITQDEDRAFHISAYAPELTFRLSELEVRMKELNTDSFRTATDWSIDGRNEQERLELSKVWKLIDDLHLLYLQGPDEQKGVKALVDKYWNQGPMKDAVDPLIVIPKERVPEDILLQMGSLLTQNNISVPRVLLDNEHTLPALALGFYQQLPVKETIIPNEHIDRFQVITQLTREGSVMAHEMQRGDRFPHFEGAYHRLNDLHNVNWDQEKQHLLVGIFKGQEIRYEADASFKGGTSILLMEAGWKPAGPGANEPYIRKVNDLYQPYALRTETIARFDRDSRELKFYDDNFQPLKYRTMNEKNEEYLQKQMQWVGFGDHLNEQLKTKLKEGNPDFALTHSTKFGKDEVAAVLNFSKSKNPDSDMVFFNRYQVIVQHEGKTDPIKQTFYIHGKEDNITLKEAYNQLSGRAVYKEMSPKDGDKYMAWEQLDFKNTDKYGNFKTKQFNENYGYDLATTLAKYPIKELSHADATERLIDSLQRGNRQQVTLVVEGKEQKLHVEAAPQWKSLNFHNEEGKRLDINKVLDGMKPEQLSQSQPSQAQSATTQQQEQKNSTAQKSSPLDDEGAPANKRGRKKGLSA